MARDPRCIAHTAYRLRSVARLGAASAFSRTQRRNPPATTISVDDPVDDPIDPTIPSTGAVTAEL
jgi:hypothetical protein